VNGEVRQSSSTSDMVFGCAALVSYISRYMTLATRRHHLHRHARRGYFRQAEGSADLAQVGDKLVTSIEKLGDLDFTLSN